MKNNAATNVAYMYDLSVFVGRFEPFHNGHLAVVETALQHSQNLLIVNGSAGEARRVDYLPFTSEEREQMILASLTDEQKARVHIRHCEDFNNMTLWSEEIRRLAAEVSEKIMDHYKISTVTTALVGHSKDNSSFYLKEFPEWDSINVDNHKSLSAKNIRKYYFNADKRLVDKFMTNDHRTAEWSLINIVPFGVYNFLKEFRENNPEYQNMVDEWDFMTKYLEPYNAKVRVGGRMVEVEIDGEKHQVMIGGREVQLFPPKFVTVDNMVVQAGHVLLIQRKARPGMGLWALPGGHLDPEEYIDQACIRELREETKLKVPDSVLKGSIVATKVFDAPHRSMRGRTITHATLFHLQPKAPDRLKDESDASYKKRVKDALALPKVRAADDAKRAKWVRLDQIKRDQMFEDHFNIIRQMVGRIQDAF